MLIFLRLPLNSCLDLLTVSCEVRKHMEKRVSLHVSLRQRHVQGPSSECLTQTYCQPRKFASVEWAKQKQEDVGVVDKVSKNLIIAK